ncbi:MAG: ATP-binding protein [Lentisphaeria bacterium]|jgi:PAS domain S-box-containing protein|nr:ATP-binding protein [Lentisphaeria bacterium]
MTNDQHNQALPNRHIEALAKVDSVLQERDASLLNPENSTSPGVALTLLDGQFIRVNGALCAMLGFSELELLATTLGDITCPEDQGNDDEQLANLKTRDIRSYQVEKRLIHKSGNVLRALVEVLPVPGADDQPGALLLQIQDIEAAKRLQEQSWNVQKMESLGRLAGCVAHDLNNALTAILGFSQLLETELKIDAQLQSFAEEITHSANRAVALTDQLKVFSTIDDSEPAVYHLNQIVIDLDGMLRRLIDENVRFDVVTDCEAGSLACDRGQLERVIVNLVVNAHDAVAEGGRITLTTGNVDRPTEAGDNDSFVRLSVSDTGTGMNDETLRQIFDQNFTTKDRGKSAGLGLFTAKQIIEQFSGTIEVESRIGLGTTFTIDFPRARSVDVISHNPTSRETITTGNETILLVEDESDVRHYVSRILTRHGYTVVEAADGVEALSIVQGGKEAIEMILTDYAMPRMNGNELAGHAVEDRPDLKILYMSGCIDENGSVLGNLKPEGSPLLKKPFSPQKLMCTVRQLLDAP